MIEIRHLKKEYENATPLIDINTVINAGDVISVIGPSGTGKSTLLRCINLLEKPTDGDIILDGKNIIKGEISPEDVRKKVGMVFQGFYLYPHLNVVENIMVPQIKLLGRTKQQAYDRAAELLKKVGLYDKRFNYPEELSGGQKQRIAIARTLAMDTEVILFDEPTSALDPTMVDEVQYVIKQLAGTGKTMLIVTHEMRFAREVANRVFFMCEGLIYEDGTPEQIFDHPTKPRTIEFINRINRKEIVIDSKYYDLPGIVSEIKQFADKNRLSFAKMNSMQHLFEELVIQLLAGRSGDDINIKTVLESSDVTGVTSIKVYHSLDFSDFERDTDERDLLSVAIIRKMASAIEIKESDIPEYLHKVEIQL